MLRFGVVLGCAHVSQDRARARVCARSSARVGVCVCVFCVGAVCAGLALALWRCGTSTTQDLWNRQGPGPRIFPATMDDPTGVMAASDAWSLASFDVRSLSSHGDEVHDFDVRSIASTCSVHSYSSAAATQMAADPLRDDDDTASTAGGQALVPLAALPSGYISRQIRLDHNDDESDNASMVSVNTRRGWPRVSPQAAPRPIYIPGARSYRDAVLRPPSEVQREQLEHRRQQQQQQTMQQQQQQRVMGSGWVTLAPKSARARARLLRGGDAVPLTPLVEDFDGEDPVIVPEL